jgi:hypothetical protein
MSVKSNVTVPRGRSLTHADSHPVTSGLAKMGAELNLEVEAGNPIAEKGEPPAQVRHGWFLSSRMLRAHIPGSDGGPGGST